LAAAHRLSREEIADFSRNAIEASFASEQRKRELETILQNHLGN
jgi:adenosine deaminase